MYLYSIYSTYFSEIIGAKRRSRLLDLSLAQIGFATSRITTVYMNYHKKMMFSNFYNIHKFLDHSKCFVTKYTVKM